MSQDTFQIRAEVINAASGTIKKISNDLQGLKAPAGLGRVREEFAGLDRAMRGVSMVGATVFSGIGLGSLSAGAAFAMLANRMKELASRTVMLQQIGRETGLLADQLKALQSVGQRFEIKPDQMLGGVQTFADKMTDIKRGLGETYGELKDIAPGFADQLRKDGADMKAAMGHAFGFLGSIGDEQLRKRWSEKLFGTPDFGRMFIEGLGKFREEWDKAQARIGQEPKGLPESAKQFNDALKNFNDAMEKFETRVAPLFLSQLAGIVEQTTRVFQQLDQLHQRKTEGDGASGLGSETGKSIGELFARQKRIQDIDSELDRLKQAPESNGAAKGRMLYLEDERRKLQDSLKEGAAEGVKMGFERMSFASGAGAGARVWNASLGGGGGFGAGGMGRGGLFGRGSGGGPGGPDGGAGSPTSPDGPISQAQGAMQRSDVVDYIRKAAAARGIDPEVALKVARSEGLNKYVGDKGTSFGPFQLHYKNSIPGLSNSGLGDTFTKATGLDARNPSTMRQQIDYALNHAAKNGWGAWHGWRGPRFAGIGAGARGIGLSPMDGGQLDSGERVIRTNDGRSLVIDRSGRALRYADGQGGSPAWPGGWEGRARELGAMRRDSAFSNGVKVEGGATIDINLNGAGKGTRSTIDHSGIVSSVSLNRGATMPTPSDQE